MQSNDVSHTLNRAILAEGWQDKPPPPDLQNQIQRSASIQLCP